MTDNNLGPPGRDGEGPTRSRANVEVAVPQPPSPSSPPTATLMTTGSAHLKSTGRHEGSGNPIRRR